MIQPQTHPRMEKRRKRQTLIRKTLSQSKIIQGKEIQILVRYGKKIGFIRIITRYIKI